MKSTNKVDRLREEILELEKESEEVRNRMADLEDLDLNLQQAISTKRKQLETIIIFNKE